MESLDPRISRLERQEYQQKSEPDQFSTFEVFTRLRKNKPYNHTGIVHAPELEMAFLFAKEQYSRRQTCTGIWVSATSDVYVSDFTDDEENILDRFTSNEFSTGKNFKIFLLLKRGKQHQYAGDAEGKDAVDAISRFYNENKDTHAFNVWAIEEANLLKIEEEVGEIWETLDEKGFRDASAYRAGEKLKNFLAKK